MNPSNVYLLQPFTMHDQWQFNASVLEQRLRINKRLSKHDIEHILTSDWLIQALEEFRLQGQSEVDTSTGDIVKRTDAEWHRFFANTVYNRFRATVDFELHTKPNLSKHYHFDPANDNARTLMQTRSSSSSIPKEPPSNANQTTKTFALKSMGLPKNANIDYLQLFINYRLEMGEHVLEADIQAWALALSTMPIEEQAEQVSWGSRCPWRAPCRRRSRRSRRPLQQVIKPGTRLAP